MLKNISEQEDIIIEHLEAKLKTSKSLENVLPKDLITTINNKIEEEVNDYINKNIENLSIQETIKNIVFENEETYKYVIDKSIKDIIGEKSLLSMQSSIKTDKFINIILLGLKDQINNYLQNYFSTEFSQEKKLEELFDGKIKEKLDKNIYNITDKASEKLIYYIKANDDLISSMVIKIVRKNLNFFVKMAYDFADGDGLVRDVVSRVINNKIENLIFEDKDKLSMILYNYLEREIYTSKIEDLGLKSTEINTSLLLDRLVFALKQNEDFKNNIYNTGDLIINNICEIKIKEISEVFEITSIQQVYTKYENKINIVSNNIIDNLNNNKESIYKFVNDLIEEKIMKNFYSISLVEVLYELNKDDVSYSVVNFLEKISASDVVNNYVSQLCKSVYNESIVNSKLSIVIDKDVLDKDIYNTLNLALQNKDFNDKNKLIIDSIINKILADKLGFISDELKLYITEHIIDAGFNTVEKNIISMLKSLDLQSITLEEVDKMHPKEIHNLFKSFAGDFFIKLYIYGFFGLIFGINVYLSIILFIIDIFYTKRIEAKIENSQYKLFRE